MPNDYKEVASALVASHDHLLEVTSELSESETSGPSYCSEWNIAQVLSHIGSGAEIGLLTLRAALEHTAPPGREAFEPIWERWNALDDREKTANAIVSDTAYIDALAAADDAALAGIEIELFGRTLNAAELLGMRLGEHVVHTWDVEVMRDSAAPLLARATGVLVDRTPLVASRLARGKRLDPGVRLSVTTTGEPRSFLFDLSGESPTLEAESGDADGTFELPAESLVRLIYGRLDVAHTPSSVLLRAPITLDDLRALYPGF